MLMAPSGNRAATPNEKRSAPSPARGTQVSISGDCETKQVADSAAVREALAELSRRLGARCLTAAILNLEHEQIRAEARTTGEMGLAACAIFPEAMASIRIWPNARQFEMDVFFTETANADVVTLWAHDLLGARAWACEVYKR